MRRETERTGYCSEGKREQIEGTDCGLGGGVVGWGRGESKHKEDSGWRRMKRQ